MCAPKSKYTSPARVETQAHLSQKQTNKSDRNAVKPNELGKGKRERKTGSVAAEREGEPNPSPNPNPNPMALPTTLASIAGLGARHVP